MIKHLKRLTGRVVMVVMSDGKFVGTLRKGTGRYGLWVVDGRPFWVEEVVSVEQRVITLA